MLGLRGVHGIPLTTHAPYSTSHTHAAARAAPSRGAWHVPDPVHTLLSDIRMVNRTNVSSNGNTRLQSKTKSVENTADQSMTVLEQRIRTATSLNDTRHRESFGMRAYSIEIHFQVVQLNNAAHMVALPSLKVYNWTVW